VSEETDSGFPGFKMLIGKEKAESGRQWRAAILSKRGETGGVKKPSNKGGGRNQTFANVGQKGLLKRKRKKRTGGLLDPGGEGRRGSTGD